MIMKMAGYVIEVDVEKTREYYISKDSVNDCTCTGCQNYKGYREKERYHYGGKTGKV